MNHINDSNLPNVLNSIIVYDIYDMIEAEGGKYRSVFNTRQEFIDRLKQCIFYVPSICKYVQKSYIRHVYNVEYKFYSPSSDKTLIMFKDEVYTSGYKKGEMVEHMFGRLVKESLLSIVIEVDLLGDWLEKEGLFMKKWMDRRW